jgi:hypothetical protein
VIAEIDVTLITTRMLGRTQALIDAVAAIRAYDFKYLGSEKQPELRKATQAVQQDRMNRITASCSEHAVISITTAIEVFLRALVQELLLRYPIVFARCPAPLTGVISALVESADTGDTDDIEKALKLGNRWDCYAFLDAYRVDFFQKEDKDFIEYLYVTRNMYVHRGGIMDARCKERLKEYGNPFREEEPLTIAKRALTRTIKMLTRVHTAIMSHMDTISGG